MAKIAGLCFFFMFIHLGLVGLARGSEQVTPEGDVKVTYTEKDITYWSPKYGIAFSVPRERYRIWAQEFGMGQNPLGESYPFAGGGFGPSFILVTSVNGDLLGRVRLLEERSQEEADKRVLSNLVASYERAYRAWGGRGSIQVEKNFEKELTVDGVKTKMFSYSIIGTTYPQEQQWVAFPTAKGFISISISGIGTYRSISPTLEDILKTVKFQ